MSEISWNRARSGAQKYVVCTFKVWLCPLLRACAVFIFLLFSSSSHWLARMLHRFIAVLNGYFATYNAEKSPQPGEEINGSHKNTLFAAEN